jgi:hypothetical protein
MEDQIRGARSELPSRRPAHLIAGVIRERRATQLTVDDLNAGGFSENTIFVLSGERGAEALRHRGEGAGFLRWAWGRFVEFAGAGDDFVRRHIEAAEQGNCVIGIVLDGASSRTRDGVRWILWSHGAHDIVSVGRGFSEETMRTGPRLIAR